jgi:hemoglobin/transferrin/lactoferrin receptor protein
MAILFSSSAPADEEVSDPEMEVIVVTARRSPQPEFTADRSLHLLSAEDILVLQGQSLPDALQETTGVFMQRTNRGAGAPFLRGLVGPENLILIDGIRFNNSTFRTGPNQYLAMIDPTAVDHLEVMLGPGSVLYGSDALGGVIQVFPLKWRKATGLGALAGSRFMSHDLSTAVWADTEWQQDGVRLLAGGTFRNLESLRAGLGTRQPISGYQTGSWRARGAYQLGDNMELGVTYLGMRIRDAGREDHLYEGSFRFYDNDDDFLYLDWRYRPGGILKELRVAPSFHRMHELADLYSCNLPDHPVWGDADVCLDAGRISRDRLPPPPLTRQEVHQDTVLTPGVLAHADLGFLGNRIRASAGLEAYFDFVYSQKEERRGDRVPPWVWQFADRGNFSDGSTYRSLGAFAHAEGDLVVRGRHSLVAGAGGRVSSFGALAADVPGVGDVEYSHTGFVGTAGVKYLYGRSFMSYLNFSQGFRAPNLQEATALGDTGSKFEVPNDGLSPERSNTLEIGARMKWSLVQFYLSAFISFMDQVIDERELSEEEWTALGIDPSAVGDKPVVQRVNSSSGLYWGVEGTASLGPWNATRLWARLAWVRAEIENRSGEVYPARRIPPLMGAAGIRYQPAQKGFYAEIFTRFAGRQTRLHPSDLADLRICEDLQNLGDTYQDSGEKCPGTDGWFTLNVRGGYQFDRWLRLDLAATNLTDELYRYHGSGVDAPGVGVSISLVGSY